MSDRFYFLLYHISESNPKVTSQVSVKIKVKELVIENFRHNPENQNEQDFEQPKIETCQLTTFSELQDYVPGDMFLKAIFEAKIPLNKD